MSNQKITSWQFFAMCFGITIGTSVLVLPSSLAGTLKQDGWIGSLFTIPITLIMVMLFILLSRQHPGLNLFQINEKVLGKWLGKLLTIVYLFYFLILGGSQLGYLGNFFTGEVLSDTPVEAIQVLYLCTAIMCVRLGAHVLARISELFFIWIVLVFFFIFATLLPQAEALRLTPIFDSGLVPILQTATHSAMFQELIVMMVLFPMLKDRRKGERAFLLGVAMGGLFLTFIVLFSIMVLGVDQTANSIYPTYALVKTINLGNFIQRMEAVLLALWIITFFMKTTMMYFAMLLGLQSLFRLKDSLMLLLPVGALFLVTGWHTFFNSSQSATIVKEVWAGYSIIHLFFVPIFLLLVWWLRSVSAKPV